VFNIKYRLFNVVKDICGELSRERETFEADDLGLALFEFGNGASEFDFLAARAEDKHREAKQHEGTKNTDSAVHRATIRRGNSDVEPTVRLVGGAQRDALPGGKRFAPIRRGDRIIIGMHEDFAAIACLLADEE